MMLNALALVGPTASGKTALSLHIATELGCEIISCDSMQIYKYMDIGTAKATADERKCVKHHMIDFLSPLEGYSAEEYRKDAEAVAADITARGKLPLFVGGTGLYIDTVMRGAVQDSPSFDPIVRDRLKAISESEGGALALWKRLSEVDPVSSELIHMNNVKRVIRALEIYELTGKPKSYFDECSKKIKSNIKVKMISLDFHNRENLYKRVDSRVDDMISAGLVDEARRLYSEGFLKDGTTAASAIGYKELYPYLLGECSLEEAVEQIKLSTRRYAKRQLTWFRHEAGAEKLYLDSEEGTLKDMKTVKIEAVALAESLVREF